MNTSNELAESLSYEGEKDLQIEQLLEYLHYDPQTRSHPDWVARAQSAEDEIDRLRDERAAWEQTAAEFCRNMEYYRGLVDRIGAMLGDAAYIADDGSRSEDILRAKVPELVAARLAHETTALPAVHGAIYDRPGWICSVCHGWNHLQDKHCTHTHAVRELTLKDFGYAPGDYSFHCLDCGQEATGDKRCSRCEPCAAQAMRENRSGLETTAHHCRAMDLANELARYFTSGNDVPVDRATVRRESDLFLILQEVLPDWNYTPMHSGQEKS